MQTLPPFLDRLVATYSTLAANVGEFLVLSVTLYLVGRALVDTIGEWTLERWQFDETTVAGLTNFLRLAVVLLAIVVGASAADFRGALAGSALIAAGVTLAIGLAAQDVLANFVAGAFLVQDPDVSVGDRIRWEEEEGFIRSIDLRVTRISTLDNEIIVVPNSELSSTVVRNLTAQDPVGFSYEFAVQHDEVGRAVETLRTVADDQDDLLDVPAPTVRVTGLLESEVSVTVRAFFPLALRSQRYRVRTAFLRAAVERCRAAGVDLNQSSLEELSGRLAVEPVDGTVERTGGGDPGVQHGGDRESADDADGETGGAGETGGDDPADQTDGRQSGRPAGDPRSVREAYPAAVTAVTKSR